jgi:hypothetical protein
MPRARRRDIDVVVHRAGDEPQSLPSSITVASTASVTIDTIACLPATRAINSSRGIMPAGEVIDGCLEAGDRRGQRASRGGEGSICGASSLTRGLGGSGLQSISAAVKLA